MVCSTYFRRKMFHNRKSKDGLSFLVLNPEYRRKNTPELENFVETGNFKKDLQNEYFPFTPLHLFPETSKEGSNYRWIKCHRWGGEMTFQVEVWYNFDWTAEIASSFLFNRALVLKNKMVVGNGMNDNSRWTSAFPSRYFIKGKIYVFTETFYHCDFIVNKGVAEGYSLRCFTL